MKLLRKIVRKKINQIQEEIQNKNKIKETFGVNHFIMEEEQTELDSEELGNDFKK